ncbi:MAG: 3-methyl-2-oxobutanoate hydroxymethyltransferase, partial [Syntrophothermus sp.]
MEKSKVTIAELRRKMEEGQQITMLTAYDYPLAILEEQAGIDIILVGDSLGMTVLGLDSTLPVTMETMITHAQAVRRGAPNAYVIGDMPYMTYQISKEEAIRNAGRFMSEAGVDAIKLEGGRNVADTVRAIVRATIPVMGHIGLTPQSIAQLGGFKSQGRDVKAALALIEDARALEDAGISSLLLEAIPPEVAQMIVERVSVPVISLGSGAVGHG